MTVNTGKLKVGTYEKDEKSSGWNVTTEKNRSGQYCEKQVDAEILSRLVRIERLLKNLKK